MDRHPASPEPDGEITAKLRALEEELRRRETVLVSYSGGLDSALLGVVARRVLGDRMACAFLDGPLVPRSAAAEAREIAERYDLPLVTIPFDPLASPAIAGNPRDRCYHCKKAFIPALKREAAARGLGTVVDGVNLSDLDEHRPGLAACAEEGVEHPYVAAGITKAEIRAIARSLCLSFAEKPPAACLASRVPYGVPLAPALLATVEEAEDLLHELGFGQCRVRVHGALARVEVARPELGRAIALAPAIVSGLKAAGFECVALDLEGYRTGAMDGAAVTPDPAG